MQTIKAAYRSARYIITISWTLVQTNKEVNEATSNFGLRLSFVLFRFVFSSPPSNYLQIWQAYASWPSLIQILSTLCTHVLSILRYLFSSRTDKNGHNWKPIWRNHRQWTGTRSYVWYLERPDQQDESGELVSSVRFLTFCKTQWLIFDDPRSRGGVNRLFFR